MKEWIRTTKITELILFKVGILKTDYINIMQTTKENILSFEALKQINERQPKEEQLKEEEIEIYAKNWEEKHLDRLKTRR